MAWLLKCRENEYKYKCKKYQLSQHVQHRCFR
jgi:hypothetical protein